MSEHTFRPTASFSGFSVDDISAAHEFYGKALGFEVRDLMGGLRVHLPNDNWVWVYQKADHQPAAFTILNFVVSDIDEAVDGLVKRGVVFEHYESIPQDKKGIARGRKAKHGPDIAWFKDPAGNILAVLQED